MPIRSKIKSFSYTTIIYGFSSLLTKIVALVLIPLYTNYLSVHEVGILALFEMLELFILSLVPLGSINAMWRYLPGLKDFEKNKMIISCFTLLIISGLIVVMLFNLFEKSFIKSLDLYGAEKSVFNLFLIACFLRVSSNFMYWLLQYENRAFLYLILSLIQFLSLIILNIFFITKCNYGIIAIFYSKIIVFIGLFVLTIIKLLYSNLTIPSLNTIKKLLSYGMPMLPLILLTPFLNFSDRYFLKIFCSIEDVGKYSIAYKFGMLINMFLVVPVQRSWGPQMFQVGIESKENEKIHHDITFYYSFVGLFIFLGLSLFSERLLIIFSNVNYQSVSWIIPWISLAYFIGGFRVFLQASASISDRTDLFIKIGIYSMISNLILNFILIKSFGITGAVASTVLSYFVLVILLFLASKSIGNIKWPVKKFLHSSIIVIILILCSKSIGELNLHYNLLIDALILILFPIVSILTKLIGKKELQGLKNILKTIFNKL